MNRQTLNLETLSVESFDTAPAAPEFAAGPTNNCDTRQTNCTIGTEL